MEPTLPQSQPQSPPEPESKPPIEIPVPNKTTATDRHMQANIEDDVLVKDVSTYIHWDDTNECVE